MNLPATDIARSRFADGIGPAILNVADEERRAVAILDGTGSWEHGDAAAWAAAASLQSIWSPRVPASPEALMLDVQSVQGPGFDFDDIVQMPYRPRFWIDDQIAAGMLTPEEARVHPLRDIYSGSMTSAGEVIGPVRSGRIIIAVFELARRLFDTPATLWSNESAEGLQRLVTDGVARLRPVIAINLS